MKVFLTLLLSSLFILSQAQHSEKDLVQHEKKKEKSLTKKTAVASLDTLFNNGIPYCLFVESEKLLGTALEITVKDLNGEDVMWCKFQDNTSSAGVAESGYEISFSRSGEQAFYETVIGNSLEKEIVKYQMFTDGNFNPGSVAKFISFNRPKVPAQVTIVTGNTNTSYPMVERNRAGMIQLFGENIQQDFKVIGTIKESQNAANGTVYKMLSVSLTNGILAATATKRMDEDNWTVTTSKDNKTHSIPTTFGNEKKEIITFLVNRLYL